MAIYNINIILLANMSLSLKSAYDTSIRKLYVGLLRVCQVSKHHTDPGDRLECQSSVYRLTTVDSRSLHNNSVDCNQRMAPAPRRGAGAIRWLQRHWRKQVFVCCYGNIQYVLKHLRLNLNDNFRQHSWWKCWFETSNKKLRCRREAARRSVRWKSCCVKFTAINI